MAKYTVSFTEKFDRKLDKLSEIDQKRVLDKLSVLAEKLSYPSLRVKKMEGGSGKYELSVTMSIRVVWKFDADENNTIVALDVGHHDVLRRY